MQKWLNRWRLNCLFTLQTMKNKEKWTATQELPGHVQLLLEHSQLHQEWFACFFFTIEYIISKSNKMLYFKPWLSVSYALINIITAKHCMCFTIIISYRLWNNHSICWNNEQIYSNNGRKHWEQKNRIISTFISIIGSSLIIMHETMIITRYVFRS